MNKKNIGKNSARGIIVTLLGIALLRVLTILGLFNAGRVMVDKDYSSGHCLMKIVNDTLPEHFSKHPLFRDVIFKNDCNTMRYLDMQKKCDEKLIFERLTIAITIIVIINAAPHWRSIFSLRFVVALFFTTSFLAAFDFVYSHFAQDIIYFSGNILHHVDLEVLFGTRFPQGFAIVLAMTHIWSNIARAVAARRISAIGNFLPDPIWTLAGLLGQIITYCVGQITHPKMHDIYTPELVNATLGSIEWKSYQHVNIHHGYGDSFGPTVFFDWIFSVGLYVFSYLHNYIFKVGLDSYYHYVLVIIFDTFLGLFVYCAQTGLMLSISYLYLYVKELINFIRK